MEFKREVVELFENSKAELDRLGQAKDQATCWLNSKSAKPNYITESSYVSESSE